MLYKVLKGIIEGGRYTTKEEFQEKLDIFFAGDRITKEQYDELTELLKSQPEK